MRKTEAGHLLLHINRRYMQRETTDKMLRLLLVAILGKLILSVLMLCHFGLFQPCVFSVLCLLPSNCHQWSEGQRWLNELIECRLPWGQSGVWIIVKLNNLFIKLSLITVIAWHKDWLAHYQDNVPVWDIMSWCQQLGVTEGRNQEVTSLYRSWYDPICY